MDQLAVGVHEVVEADDSGDGARQVGRHVYLSCRALALGAVARR